jgi:hypothetical protein
MGREIRRVPPTWEHPKDGRGHYKPLYDNDYETAAQKWETEYAEFMATPPEERQEKYFCAHYWDYSGVPDEEYYRVEKWTTEQATAYQIYETVSEGTPVSPVFPDLDHMIQWLVEQGYGEKAANLFAKAGWVPSMTITPTAGIRMDIHALDD